jgi:hypothetical protein
MTALSIGAVPDIDDGSVLIRTDSGPEGMSSAVHPRLQALADANNEVERLRARAELAEAERADALTAKQVLLPGVL